jgi:uncharacterized protein YceK
MLKAKGLLIAVAAILILANCATIMQGTNQSVGISSYPSGANITIDNLSHGTTPLTAKLSRKDNHVVKIELDGYLPYELALSRKVSGWVAGNILFGGLIGLAVDAISGGLYKITPEDVQANLEAVPKTSELNKDEYFITVVLQPNPNWEKIGQLEKK